MGDIPGSGGGVAEFVGGTGGAILGTMINPGAGSVVGAGAGALIGRDFYNSIIKTVFPTVDSRKLTEKAGDAFVTFAINAVGQKSGELLQKYISKAVKKTGPMVGKGEDTTTLMKAYEEVGAQPTAGQISGSKTVQSIESALQNMPISSDVLDASYQGTIDSMDKYSRQLISRLGGIGDDEATGTAIERGTKSFVEEFSAKGGKLYDKLDEFIQPGTQIDTPSFNDTVKEVMQRYASDIEFAEILTPKSIKLLDAAVRQVETRGGMTYSTFKALRRQLGNEMKGSSGVLDDVTSAEIKQLYGAISDDMGVVASNVGEEAFKAFTRANTFWRAGRQRIDNVISPLVEKSNGLKIYNAVTKGAPSEVATMRKSLPKEQWDKVVGQVINNMGRANPGAQSAAGDIFSPATFLTNYNKLSPAVKRQLFGHDPLLAKSLDSLTKVSGSIKDMAGVANTSRTAQAGVYMGMLMGGLGGVEGYRSGGAEGALKGVAMGLAGGVAVPYMASKLMTSKGFVNWLADAATIATDTPKAMGAHILRLHLISEREPHIKEEVRQYLTQLSNLKAPEQQSQTGGVPAK